MGSKICKPKMMDCLTCPKNNPNESFCFDKGKCSVPSAMVRDGKIIAWEENKEDKKMRCADCGLYECALRSPLGGCPNGEAVEQPRIITAPDTRPWDGVNCRGLNDEAVNIAEAIVYLTTHGWTCIAPQGIDAIAIQKAASNLVDAVDRYTMGKCLRSELLIKNNELKNLLK